MATGRKGTGNKEEEGEGVERRAKRRGCELRHRNHLARLAIQEYLNNSCSLIEPDDCHDC